MSTVLHVDNQNKLAGLESFQAEAQSYFNRIGLPTNQQEAFKYFNVDALSEFAFAQESKVNSLNALPFTNAVDVIISPDGVEIPAELEDKLSISAFSDLNEEQLSSFTLHTPLDNVKNPLALLNAAQFSQGLYIAVEDGAKIERPVRILLNSNTDSAINFHPRIYGHIGANSRVSLIIEGQHESDTASLINLVTDIHMHDDADCDLTVISNDSNANTRFHQHNVVLRKKSKFNAVFIVNGSKRSRFETNLHFLGEEADAQLAGVSVLKEASEVFTHTNVQHHAGYCTCDQQFKTILDDQTVSEYNGLVYVHPDAQKTDSSQYNKNILLSDHCRALARPQLEIFADDVECAHGSSTGQLDDEQVYYLQSRGISLEKAREVLLFGFVEEILDYLGPKGLKPILSSLITKRMMNEG